MNTIIKRIIISLIVTIIVLIVTNKYWLTYSPIPINFDIKSNGTCKIEIQLNEKDNNDFKDIKKEAITINSNINHINIFVNNAKHPKRFRILFSNLASNAQIIINNLQFNDKNINSFNATNAKLITTEKEITIYPLTDLVTLTYPNTLQIKAEIKFNFVIFCIILTGIFILIYKISKFIANLDFIKKQSRIDITFLALFFFALFIPIMHINNDDISKQENRSLTKWKPLILDNYKINTEFGNDFNSYFNDRFNFREILVKTYTNIKYNMAYLFYEKNGIYLNKKTHYMSSTNVGNPLGMYDNEMITNITTNIRKLQDFCKSNNIKFYILIIPYKTTLPNSLTYPINRTINSEIYYKETQKAIDIVTQKTGQKIIYPYKEILNLSGTQNTYFKTDHHWTDDSAYIAYLQLMTEIKKDFKNVSIKNINDFNYIFSKKVRVEPNDYYCGRTYEALGLDDEKILDTEYKYYELKNIDKIIFTAEYFPNEAYKLFNYENTDNINAPNIILYGDSYTLNLLPIIPGSFHFVNNIYRWYNGKDNFFNINCFKKYILDKKPNVFVFCSFDLNRLQDILEIN